MSFLKIIVPLLGHFKRSCGVANYFLKAKIFKVVSRLTRGLLINKNSMPNHLNCKKNLNAVLDGVHHVTHQD